MVSDDRREGSEKDGRWVALSAQRKVRAAQSGVPGESQGGGRESVDSPDWRADFGRGESNSDEGRSVLIERSEKGNPPCSNLRFSRQRRWLAEAGSREQSRRRRRDRCCLAMPREMTIRTELGLLSFFPRVPRVRSVAKCMVPIAQLVRAPVCGTGGYGFNSRWAPREIPSSSKEIHEGPDRNKCRSGPSCATRVQPSAR